MLLYATSVYSALKIVYVAAMITMAECSVISVHSLVLKWNSKPEHIHLRIEDFHA